LKTVDKPRPDGIVAGDGSSSMEHEANGTEFRALEAQAGTLPADSRAHERRCRQQRDGSSSKAAGLGRARRDDENPRFV